MLTFWNHLLKCFRFLVTRLTPTCKDLVMIGETKGFGKQPDDDKHLTATPRKWYSEK